MKKLYSALMTAFNEDGSVNLDGVREMVRYNIDVNHIDGLYVGGSTGETFMLSTEEKKSIFKVAYEEAAGKTHLIAQVGSLNLNEAKEILKNNGYIVESKVATKEDFDNLFKLCGFEKTKGKFDWIKKVYQRYGKGYLKAIIGQDYCKIVYFRFDPTLHWDDEKCYELNDSYKVSFDEEDAIALLRDYIMDYDQE